MTDTDPTNSQESREFKSEIRAVIQACIMCCGDHRESLPVPCENYEYFLREGTFELGIEKWVQICQVDKGVRGTSGRGNRRGARESCAAEEL